MRKADVNSDSDVKCTVNPATKIDGRTKDAGASAADAVLRLAREWCNVHEEACGRHKMSHAQQPMAPQSSEARALTRRLQSVT